MSYKNWEINGCSLFFDTEDLESMERYEQAFGLLEEERKKLPKDGKATDRIRAYCALFQRLYNRIFGDDASEKIFSNVRMNIDAYDEIYFQFLEFIRHQGVEGGRQKAERLSHYQPKNRKQKRHNKYRT